jgi:TruD family tRNA pseudouridine synthase
MAHPHVVCCLIKHTPDDFNVVEVDQCGVAVDAPDYSIPQPSPQPAHQPGPTPPPQGSEPPLTPRWDVSRSYEPLERFLSAELVLSLSRLACSNEAQQVPLGEFEDKHVRGALRCAIRWHHPNLATLLDGSTLTAVRDMDVFPAFERCVGSDDAGSILRASIVPDPSFQMHISLRDGASKDDRRAFHVAFQKACSHLYSVVRDGMISITPRKRSAAAKRPRAEDGVPQAFTHFVVHKYNVEHQRMRELLGRHCGVSDSNVCVAGMKDRRGATWQRVSISGDVCAKVPAGLRLSDGEASFIAVAPNCTATTHTAPLAVGDLRGNMFRLVVRCTLNTPTSDGEANAFCDRLRMRLDDMSAGGSLNYFGAQRFGRGGLPGLAMLKGDWCGAVMMILSTAPDGALESLRATGDFGAFRKAVNPRTHRDAHLLGECLLEVGRRRNSLESVRLEDMLAQSSEWAAACRAAILKMPFYLRQLWLHAAQSHVFNESLERCVASGQAIPATLPLIGSADISDPTSCLVMEALSIDASALVSGTVAGVPLRGSMRPTIVKPTGCSLQRLTDRPAPSPCDLWLKCSFTLPSSSYATVLLHQLLGCEPTDAAL